MRRPNQWKSGVEVFRVGDSKLVTHTRPHQFAHLSSAIVELSGSNPRCKVGVIDTPKLCQAFLVRRRLLGTDGQFSLDHGQHVDSDATVKLKSSLRARDDITLEPFPN